MAPLAAAIIDTSVVLLTFSVLKSLRNIGLLAAGVGGAAEGAARRVDVCHEWGWLNSPDCSLTVALKYHASGQEVDEMN